MGYYVYSTKFWENVTYRSEEKCWTWNGQLQSHGIDYGRFCQGYKKWRAHRYAFLDFYGFLPPLLRHTCDNKRCINPHHLIPGEPKDNSRDAAERGRMPRGTCHPNSKLRDAQVLDIYALRPPSPRARKGRESAESIGKRYGVSNPTVCAIWSGRMWSWLTGHTSEGY